MYFQKFPVTLYTLDDASTVQLIRNFLIRFSLSDEIKNNYVFYDEYDIRDGETPEILAYKFYNNSQLHWVILQANDILDPRFEWCLAYNDLIKYSEGKYNNINSTHHYVNSDGLIVNSTASGAVAVTNLQYEIEENEKRRRIKVIKPQYIESLLREFNNKLEIINV